MGWDFTVNVIDEWRQVIIVDNHSMLLECNQSELMSTLSVFDFIERMAYNIT